MIDKFFCWIYEEIEVLGGEICLSFVRYLAGDGVEVSVFFSLFIYRRGVYLRLRVWV